MMTAPRDGEVLFRELPRAEVEEMIARNNVGRILKGKAMSLGARGANTGFSENR